MKKLLLLLVSFILLTGCQKKSEDSKIHLAVIPKATTGAFWQTVHAGARKAAHELGVKIAWLGPEKEDQRAKQISAVGTQILNKVDGIILAPLDRNALLRPVQEAVRAKVPVVIMDSALAGPDDLYVSFVATDNYKGGRLAGKNLGKLLKGSGKVAMLRHMEGSASTTKRESGFLQALKKFPNIQVVSSEQYGGRDPQKAAENLLLRFTQNGTLELDGIFCPSLGTTYGMMQALRRARLNGKIRLVGFDSDNSLVEGIEKGDIDGLIIQDPFKIGYFGVKNMVDYLRGQKVSKRMDTGVVFVSRENLREPKIQEQIHPDLKRWLK